MSQEEKHSEEFDLYLKGGMSEAEKQRFEARLAEDAALADAFQVHRILVEGIKDHERLALKTYLKENGKVLYWGENIWPKSIRFAAAAVFILFIGLYFVIKTTVQPDIQKEVALQQNEAPRDDKSADTRLADSSQITTAEVLSTPSRESDASVPELVPIMEDRPESIREDIAPVEMQENEEHMNRLEYNTSAAKDYKVLSEKKLKDSMFSAPVLALNVNRKTNLSKTTADQSTYGRAKTKQLPQNAGNNNQAAAMEKTQTLLDSNQADDSKELKKTESKDLSKTLMVEYWSSPLNYKGYRYINNIVQVYSIDAAQTSFYFYNNKLYMRSAGKVYVLEPCTDACPFRVEPDTDIVNYILIQK